VAQNHKFCLTTATAREIIKKLEDKTENAKKISFNNSNAARHKDFQYSNFSRK
jgi:hypothetical protein